MATKPSVSNVDDLIARRDLWPIRDVCARLSIGRSTLYREIRAGAIHTVKVGAKAYVTDRELRRYLRALERSNGNGKAAG